MLPVVAESDSTREEPTVPYDDGPNNHSHANPPTKTAAVPTSTASTLHHSNHPPPLMRITPRRLGHSHHRQR
eukprot:m.132942 g.132942  ORF g.132942 m.132942 type:complete len:72 (+) comp11346_c1_seq2:293-508(+)